MQGFFSPVELQMTAPVSLTPKCGACGLHKGCKSPKMEPTGKGKRRVLIVAEAPGEDEDRKGIQLVGKTGQHLERVLTRIGVDMRKDCWLTNALICRPPNNQIDNDERIDWCRPNLIKTIARFNPEVIIPLGAVAVKSLMSYLWSTDVGSISRWVGWRIPCQELNAWICPTWHPSFVVRKESRVVDGYFQSHLKAAFKLKGRPFEEVPNYEDQVDLIYDVDDASAWLDNVTSGIVAFDYECNMLKPESEKAKIVSCSVCWNGEETIAFPFHGKVKQSMRRLLRDRNVKKIASNMKYESRWSSVVLGTQVRGWHLDTMLAAHLLDCRRGITSIKFLSFVHLGQAKYDTFVEPYLHTQDGGGNTPNRVHEIPLDKLLMYNGLDSLLEFLVAAEQCREFGLQPIL